MLVLEEDLIDVDADADVNKGHPLLTMYTRTSPILFWNSGDESYHLIQEQSGVTDVDSALGAGTRR